jgi:hypothetical protein
MRRTARITDLLRNRSRALVFAGAAAALAGAGAVSASTAASASTAPQAAGASIARAAHTVTFGLNAFGMKPAAPQLPAPAKPVARAATASASKPHVTSKPSAARVRAATRNMSWTEVHAIVARESDPVTATGQQGMAEQLRPVAASGPQESMPMTPARMANATTIVKQDLAEKMGLRSAVIAVATSMQESTLENINYGTSDSLGLFQQRPSCGWGTAAQITDPAYAARAFLTALHKYQATDPQWASQPLWQSAQGVQASGYPTAYAKWEAQAANIVQHVTTHLV